MPLQKLQFRPGVNREGTTLANEGGWFDCDKVRFRSGYPEKIGGWAALSYATFLGTCRSLWNWVSLKGFNLLGVGTNLKFYIENGGGYYDITPIRQTATLSNPFVTTSGSAVVTVTDANHGAITGDYVSFSGASTVGGLNLNSEYVITYVDSNTYTITASANASSSATGGGTSVVAQYQINAATGGGSVQTGWGAGLWGGIVTGSRLTAINVGGGINSSTTTITVDSTAGFPAGSVATPGVLLIDDELITYTGTSPTTFTGCTRGALGSIPAEHLDNTVVQDASGYYGWGESAAVTATNSVRLWSQSNFGEDLLFSPQNGALYLWQPGSGVVPAFDTRGVLVGSLDALANTSNTSTTITITSISNGALVFIGMEVSGTGITAGTTITAFGTGTGGTGTYTISNPATATNTGITLTGTSDVPNKITEIMVSDSSRIVIAFGCNDYGSSEQDPMLIRWTTQESYTNWTPETANQAGSYRLSHGSRIVGALQTRQEIIVWTDSAIYSMQYLGPPFVWGFTLLADNISIASQNAMATAAGVVYWMGVDKFYVYSGRVETLPCSVRQYVYGDINIEAQDQFLAGSNEGYSEIWWFYCSLTGPDGSGTEATPNTIIDRYVIFNYLDRVWYYGTMTRTAWLDSALRGYPMAATANNLIVYHEAAVDNGETNPPTAINAYIQSSDFDIDDGHNYGFVWRILPDITFDGSNTSGETNKSPFVTFTVRPRQNPGAAYGGSFSPTITSAQSYAGRTTYNVQEFTEIVYSRVRGRQMAFRVESNTPGTQWQLGVPRIDVRPDGRN
jgi:hypothetical protein